MKFDTTSHMENCACPECRGFDTKGMMGTVRASIMQHGLIVICVVELGHPFMIYSIGNYNRKLSEIILFGPPTMREYIAQLSKIQKERGKVFENGELVETQNNLIPFKMVRATGRAISCYTHMASWYFGHTDYTVTQALVPDYNGIYPGEPGCQDLLNEQPRLDRELN